MSLGKLITNLQTTFITEDEKDDNNHLSLFQSQGEKYLKYNEMLTDEIKPQFNLMENFSLIKDNAVETKNNSEIQALIDLDKEYKKKLADYSKQRQLLMSDTNTYINKISSAQNKLLGKNVRFNNGEMAYITNEGLFKKYDSSEIYQNTIGKNGCPSNSEKLNININGNKIDTDPPLKSGTPMSLGQSCGNAGKNVYAINSGKPGNAKYVGCYVNSSDNGLIYQSDMGSTADVESCKYRAFDKGNSVFAVGSGGKGSSKCYIGTNIERVKTGVQSKIYKETWNSGGPFPNATMGGLNNAGQLVITNYNNKEVYYESHPPQENCDTKYGGGINFSNTIATFGGNCLNAKKQGNWTNYLKTLDIQGKPNGSFVLLDSRAPKPFNVDPAKRCSKDFRANYQCGTGINKNVFIKPNASGKAATFNCIKEHKLCIGYRLVMKNDGNLVIYNNKSQATWSSKTASNIGVNNPEKSASKGKNGRNYLNSGEYLNNGEFIGSSSGNCYLKMTKGVGLQIIISLPGCSNVGNETYGFINTSENKILKVDSPSSINSLAVYTIPISFGYDNIGKVGYVTPDNKLKEYPQNLISRSNNYIELGNFSNPGNDIKTINAKTPEECMTGCNQTNGCEGFVFNPNGTCSLKNSNMYPKTPRIKTSNVNVLLYKRSVNLKNNNSCSKNAVPINGSLWGNYVKDGTMSQAVVCKLENYTKEQQVKLEASRKDLQQTITEIHKRLIALDETDKKLLSSYGLTKKNLEKDMSTFQLVYKEKQNIDNKANTLQGMHDASEDEMISENYKNIVWSVVAILLIIGSIKLLK